ncbi:ArsR/SmtB family transcription factor [Bacillus chungangensis]|uniref:ArsR family transcriptional regulator n=1 Tax=Bacillus chungangensis TaxID=587633 RepID=A0ABT9WP38_9BACI|nr:metalloregulator ArsR/SmtB family transcription factor [Bacillus chungangensis]MDQ0175046.1 ArsR family transcriptional regulator [Bacillus chungangensis]
MAFSNVERFLKAVGEETRLKIISYLTFDSFCVCELVELLQMSQPSVSQHLRKLKQAEIILEDRRGKWVFYSLNKNHQLFPVLLHLVSTLPSLNNDIGTLVIDGKRILCE